jgi:hypothetical protein
VRFAAASSAGAVRVARSARAKGREDGTCGRARFVNYGWVMKDLLYVAITVGFFAISWFYVRAAERL